VVCRELTKTHEEIKRGTLGELAAWAADGVLGEITIVVAGAPAPAMGKPGDAPALVAAAEAGGLTRKDAITQVAADLGLRRRDVYNEVVRRPSS
jgi:16S rRNA (cytidine1402-2'-O)-methyltransferase